MQSMMVNVKDRSEALAQARPYSRLGAHFHSHQEMCGWVDREDSPHPP